MKKYRLTIFLLFLLLVPFHGAYAAGSSLLISSSTKEVSVGDSITVTFLVSSADEAMNAASGTVPIPSNLELKGISKTGSIVNFWTEEPHAVGGKIQFEGIVLNPGYKGPSGKLFTAVFVAKRSGAIKLNYSDGSVLANDGLGSNILDKFGSLALAVNPAEPGHVPSEDLGDLDTGDRVAVVPVITEYSQAVDSKQPAYVKGKGEPNALTKIKFNDLTVKSIGERFILSMQSKKKKPDEAIVRNNPDGTFEYVTPGNLVAGVYNATPFLVDAKNNTETAGAGVQLLVNDSAMVHWLVVLINVLALLVPVVGLAVLIYFIPWYSWLRMRIIKRKLRLEEEKIQVSGHQLEREDKKADQQT